MKKAVKKTNLTIIILLTIIIVIMINYLSFRHYRIWDFTKQKIYSISEKAKKVIAKLDSGHNIFLLVKKSNLKKRLSGIYIASIISKEIK